MAVHTKNYNYKDKYVILNIIPTQADGGGHTANKNDDSGRRRIPDSDLQTFPAIFSVPEKVLVNFILCWQEDLFDLTVSTVHHDSSLYTSHL